MIKIRKKIIQEEIIGLFKSGFFHIFTSQVVNKIINFSSSVFIVRLISKTDFGIYSYASNIISMFMLMQGLGVISGLLQFGSENRNNPHKLFAYSKFAEKIGLIVSLLMLIIICIYAKSFSLEVNGAANILLLLSFRTITDFLYSYIEIGFRIRQQNKAFSYLSIFNSLTLFICTVVGAYFWGVTGVVLFQYASLALSIICAKFLANKLGHKVKTNLKLTSIEKRAFFKLSFVSSLNNAISQMLFLLDIFVLGIVIKNTSIIASYKIATTIPFAMMFIPGAIITYVYPYFASHNTDWNWIRVQYYRLLKRLVIFNGMVCVIMYVFATIIIKYIFGSQYMDAVTPFRILSIGYFIAATFRIPSGNILVTLRKVNINFYNALISGILNIILSVVFITFFGPIGAASATLCVYIISSLISTIYLNLIINKRQKLILER